LNFIDRFLKKNTQDLYFLKILPVGVELFHVGGWTDGQTDMTKVIVAFRNFKKASHKQNKYIKKENERM